MQLARRAHNFNTATAHISRFLFVQDVYLINQCQHHPPKDLNTNRHMAPGISKNSLQEIRIAVHVHEKRSKGQPPSWELRGVR